MLSAPGSHESDGGVQYHAARWFHTAGSHESDGGVQYQSQVSKVVVYGSDSRSGSCFNDMLYGREVVGNGGAAIGARRCYARTRTPRTGTVTKNSRGEWERVTIVIGRVKNVRSHLPLIRVMASMMQ